MAEVQKGEESNQYSGPGQTVDLSSISCWKEFHGKQWEQVYKIKSSVKLCRSETQISLQQEFIPEAEDMADNFRIKKEIWLGYAGNCLTKSSRNSEQNLGQKWIIERVVFTDIIIVIVLGIRDILVQGIVLIPPET